MSRSGYDFNFEYAFKPCDQEKRCIEDSEERCPYFHMCDLAIKDPPKLPTVDWRTVKRLNFG